MMFKNKILFFVGRSYLVESAAYLSFELMKKGFLTSIFCPFLETKYIKSFNNIFYYFSLDKFLISIILFPFFFFYLAYLVFLHDIIIIYQVKLSFLIRFWCIVFRKKFYIIHSNAEFSFLDSLFSRYANKIFYVFPTTKLQFNNAILSGLPLSIRYKFSYIESPKHIMNITFFVNNYDINSILNGLSILLPIEVRKKLQINVIVDNIRNSEFNIIAHKDFVDYVLIKNSHLIISYANTLMLSKISKIGRPVYLVCSEKMQINFNHHLKLKGAFSGTSEDLALRILEYFKNHDLFYENCKSNANVFFESVIKQYIN